MQTRTPGMDRSYPWGAAASASLMGAGPREASGPAPAGRPPRYRAGIARATTAKWQPAAATTSAWKTSWYPKTLGNGSGRLAA